MKIDNLIQNDISSRQQRYIKSTNKNIVNDIQNRRKDDTILYNTIVKKHNYYDKSNFEKIQVLADMPVEKWHKLSFISNKRYAKDLISFLDAEIANAASNFKQYYEIHKIFINNILHMNKMFSQELMYNLYDTKLKYILENIKILIGEGDGSSSKDVNNTKEATYSI